MSLEREFADRVAHRCVQDSLEFWAIADDWETGYRFERLNEDVSGECTVLLDYKRARITLDLEQIETSADLWRCMAHEVAHIVTAEYKLMFRVFACQLPEGGADDADQAVWHFADERTVCQLERVFLRERPYPGDDAFRQKEVAT